jgi:ABC-2 type transport system permease protein
VAWLFVRLKLSLLAGGLRGDRRRRVGFVVSVTAATIFAVVGCTGLTVMRFQGEATDSVIVVYTALGLTWTLLPLVSFGIDETLDPTRLSLFPLTRAQMFRGLLAAAVTGPWPVATLIVLAGGVAGLAAGPGSVAVGLVCVPLTLMLYVAAARACATGMSNLLRSRRGRDVGMAVALVIMLSVQGVTVLASGGAPAGADAVVGAADGLRWLPPGMAAHAIGAAADGRYGVALAEVAAVAIVVAALLWAWMAALGRALITADASTQTTGRVRLRGWGWSPTGRTGAILVKELRYAWRDPRRRMSWLSAAGMTVILGLGSGSVGPFFPVCMTAMIIGAGGANGFGNDGPALWMHAVVTGRSRDLRADLAGKNLASALLGTVVVLAVSVLSTAMHGVPADLPRVFLAGLGVLGIGIGVATVVSVLFPYALPEHRGNVLGHPGAGKGGVAFAAALSSTGGALVLSLPVLVGNAVGGPVAWTTAAIAPFYGAAIAWAARRFAARLGINRLPEILVAVGRTG